MEKSPKYYIITYGCQMNMYDSDLIGSVLENNGYVQAQNEEEADLIIVNTCSVREHAEKRAIGRIENLMKYKKLHNTKIGVAGCMVEAHRSDIKKIIPDVDFVIRPNQYDRVYEIVSNNIYDLTDYDTATYEGLYNKHIHNGTNFVPIMRGCNNFCTYCIVPYTRGREKSRSADDIIKEINLIYEKGGLDITLLGQNVNSYNYKDLDFPALLNRIVKETDIPRIRFLTSHPKDLSDKLIDMIFSTKRICKSLHLPVQSGSNKILTKMNRGYKIEEYKEIINRIRNVDKEFVITTDIIVGFPGETEGDYNMTLELVNDIRYDFAYMFKYSPRTGTPAAKFKDQIPEEIKLDRLNRLIDIQNSISYDKNREMIGKTYEVFFEGISKRNPKELYGRTDGNKIVVYNGEYSRTAKVIIKSIRGHTPFGLKI